MSDSSSFDLKRPQSPLSGRRAVRVAKKSLVDARPLNPDRKLPIVLTPSVEALELEAWVVDNRALLDEYLHENGGILFRGFGIDTQECFERAVTALSIPLMNYMESATPRTKLGDRVYTSTEFPPDQEIAPHNELSYVVDWPMKIAFCCVLPARVGGETPIVDVRSVLAGIDPKIVARFEEKGWMLVRNFGDGFGLPWQQSFHLSDRAEAEAYFKAAEIEFEWKDGDRLRTRQVRPAVAVHPRTGVRVWFNHVAFWHVTSLPESVRSSLLREFGEENLPYNTYYGDGSPIEPEVARALRDAYARESVDVPWQKGDLVLLDNMLAAHGRKPFEGPRRVLVAMGERVKQLSRGT